MNRKVHNRLQSVLRCGVACFLIAVGIISSDAADLMQKALTHWAFQPITRPAVPVKPGSAGVSNPIDQFIEAKLATAGLLMSKRATKQQLIRRVTLDLIGLPPTVGEIDTFMNDPSSRAYERLVDRLLESPHYGERWGRHWLDLARFAESDGFEHDAVRPHSWRYRDYVIRSFNEDKPYDRFIREQIAGDEFWPEEPGALTATSFNLLGPDMVDSSDQVQRRHNSLNDMTDTAALAFLGLTMGCARCHDHKFEPLSQKDYYCLQAFFASAKFNREHPIPTAEERARYEKELREYNAHPMLRELAELEAPVRKEIFERKVAALSPEAQMAHRTPVEERNAQQANLVLETQDKVTITEQDLAQGFAGESKARRKALLEEVKRLTKPESLPKTMALEDGPAVSTFILHRGDYNQPRESVIAGFPSILCAGSSKAENANRTALANWIASPQNPLTARVIVNRIWQHHFGRGLVITPSDFGLQGAKPTHPELLDWLASEFMDRGWSIKKMHKLMLMSATYQQSSESGSENMAGALCDPENKLYWRMNRLRLEGEVVRDCLLAISGKLNPKMGGPGVLPPIPKELFAGAAGWSVTTDTTEHARRSIYIFARRNLRFPFLEVFDAPDNNLSCPIRERSTTAPQSLTLLNSDEVMNAARATATRIEKEKDSIDDQIKFAYKLILGHEPSAVETGLSRDFLKHSPRTEFCRALFNLNDFVYIQ